ncbi:Zinc-binding dehydrogenase [Pleurostoma richardsiae]|uniref:Dehydrogenase FUB6 n=1 Tax=Pleurostoma richardsiae TaxID=41990 RepID=A0AA38R6N6_9PEZI|nr:Zinc-binding dehydrogenase [Pleurostoma richardsiae]
MVQNKALVFTEVPETLPVAGKHLQIHATDFDPDAPPPAGGFTARVLYASFDPYLRHRLVAPEAARDGFEPLPVGSVIPNTVLAKVLRSDAVGLAPGSLVIGMAPIQEYITIPGEVASQFHPLDSPEGVDPKLFLGPLGMPGLTAYAGLYEIGRPKRGETIFVSAATGAVGQMVGQLAKREGLRVIGSAGSDEKVKLLTEVFKFDGAFNHRDGDVRAHLERLAPDGIDIYYDNVGGEQLEAAVNSMKPLGRIVACGYSSQYNVPASQQYGIRTTSQVIGKRITWRGMSVFDDGLGEKYRGEHQEKVGRWISEGSLEVVLSETKDIDNAPEGLIQLFAGRNIGKSLLNFGVV